MKVVLIASLDKEDPPSHSFVDGMLARELAQQPEMEVKLLVSRARSDIKLAPYRYYKSICIPVLFQRRRFGRFGNFLLALWLLRKLIIREKAKNNIVVLFVRNDPVLLLASAMLRSRVSRLVFQSSFPHEEVARGMKKVTARLFYSLSAGHIDSILAVSPLGLDRLRRLFPLVSDSSYIPLMSDVKCDKVHVPGIRHKGKDVRFVYVGSHGKLRRIDIILKAIVHAINILGASGEFIFVGGNKAEISYCFSIEGVSELARRGIILFKEKVCRKEVWETIEKSDVGLCLIPPLAILREASPTKLAEYMAFGLAVLASKGIPLQEELLEYSDGGILVEFDYRAMANAIHKLSSNHEELIQMQMCAYEYAQNHLDYSVCVSSFKNKVLGVYNQSEGRV